MKKASLKEPAPPAAKQPTATTAAGKPPTGNSAAKKPDDKLAASTPSSTTLNLPPQSQPKQRRSNMLRKDDLGSSQSLPPPPAFVVLSTGLELLFTGDSVKKIWEFAKPKLKIHEVLADAFKRKHVEKNFESMELNIIVEFHQYNLVFAKQRLFLSDQHSAILLNLLWTLLINDNADYGVIRENQMKAVMELGELERKNIHGLPLKQEVGVPLQKSIERDSWYFKRWLTKHSVECPPHCVQIFTQKQIEMIVDFTKEMYFSNYTLYRYCLNNKKRSEETRIHLYIDKPFDIPPLSEALYMGRQRLEIPEEDDENSESKRDQLEQERLEMEWERERAEREANLNRHLDPAEELAENTRRFVEGRLRTVQDQFDQQVLQRKEAIHQKFDEIVNPPKKKK